MRAAVSIRIPSPWAGPSARGRRLWPPSLVIACIAAVGCSATPLQAEPHRGDDAATPARARVAVAPLTTSGVPRDPLDALRERLADKLKVSKTRDATGTDALRVTSHAAADDQAAAPQKGSASSAAHGVARRVDAPLSLAAAARAGALLPRTVPTTTPRSASPGLPAQWDYDGSSVGPQAWSRLKPEFATCAVGKRQSPIDIRDGIKVQLDAVQFDYRPSAFSVVDNGHTVQVNIAPGNSIRAMGRRYDLVQFHFHRPSEERVNGRVFDMVAHLVHRDPEGHLAVVAVLLDRGSAHPLVQAVWNNLPLEKGDEVPARLPLDLEALLPTERSYYTYMGSMTTPPCSEGVLWMVMKNPVAISDEQLAIFARLYPMNARPIQSAAGRLIKESN